MAEKKTGLEQEEIEELRARLEYGANARATQVGGRLYRFGETPAPRASKMLREYVRGAHLRAVKRERKQHILRVPTTFSLIDNPDPTLETLSELVTVARSGTPRIYVNQEDCTSLDLCAGSVLNVLALEAGQKLRTVFAGRYPQSREVLELVIATGLPKALALPLPTVEEIYPLDIVEGGRGGDPFRSSEKELASEKVVAYVRACFARYGYEILRPGIRHLGKLLSEVLDNAEEHGGGRWWVAGYLRHPRGRAFGDCHLSIFNFGPTLAETLRSIDPNTDLWRDIEATVAAHRRGGFLGLGVNRWTEEALWTLYALQEGVSRFYPESRRGAGTAEMIQAFQNIGQVANGAEQPQMCLVSGQTHIRFDPDYPMRENIVRGAKRRIIALNTENDLLKPPAPGTILNLSQRFPGTMISLRFFLDPVFLQKSITVSYG